MPCVRASSGLAGAYVMAVDLHVTVVGFECACDHVHQRALARAVLADQRVDFARAQFEIHAIERDSWTKRFANSF